MSEPIFLNLNSYNPLNGNSSYAINVNKISMIVNNPHGGCTIYLEGCNEKVYMNNYNSDQIKNMIVIEITRHYNEVAERTILGR